MFVIIGVFGGVVSDVAIRTDEIGTRTMRAALDKLYDKERDEDGRTIDGCENDVVIFEVDPDGEIGDTIFAVERY